MTNLAGEAVEAWKLSGVEGDLNLALGIIVGLASSAQHEVRSRKWEELDHAISETLKNALQKDGHDQSNIWHLTELWYRIYRATFSPVVAYSRNGYDSFIYVVEGDKLIGRIKA